MKKTTTRLASSVAVIVVSVFAILLAQHDARKTSEVENEISTSQAATEPPMPLAVDQFSGGPQVVRGNNDGAIDDRMTGYDNPLREDQFAAAANSLADLGNQLLAGASEVVAASGEAYAEPYPQSGTDSAPQLQPIPTNLGDNLPSLSNFGSPSTGSAPNYANNLPSTANNSATALPRPNDTQPLINSNAATGQPPAAQIPSASGLIANSVNGALPSTTNSPGSSSSGIPATTSGSSLPSTARLGMPTAPAPAVNGGTQSGQNNRTPAMSDIQRGAMLPTQLADTNKLPASYGGSGIAQNNNVQLPNTQLGNAQLGINVPVADSRSRSDAPNFNSAAGSSVGGTGYSNLPPAMTALPSGPSGNSFGQDSGSLGSSIGSNAPGSNSVGLNTAGFNSPNLNSQNLNTPNLNSRAAASNGLNAGPTGNQFASADSAAAMGARATLVSNQPGSRFLDGSQNPAMQIQKRAPEEVTVGKKASFVIVVRNAGNAAAHDVTVVDRVPRGSRFAEASPGVTPTADGVLVWKLGEMGPGDEKTINLQIIPEVEGEVGSIASVHIAAQASVRSMATAPQLELQVDGAAPVLIGQGQDVMVTIRNSGTGVARGIRLEADIPSQMKHVSGESQIEAELGDIRPGDSRRLTLNIAAIQPGQAVCPLRVVNEDGVQAQTQFNVDVRAPKLVAAISGPAKRYLERQATYQIVVNNTGTAMARNLYFDVHLPVGLKFVSADIAQATYHPESHSVTLGLAELNSGANAAFSVTVLPVELGPQNIRISANADLGVSAEAKGQMTVEGLSELAFTIGQDNGTVEVGATTTYAVQVSNVGNQSDRNVVLQVQLPEGAKLVKVDSPVDYREEGSRIVFNPLGEMRSRDAKTFRFQVQHQRAGNQVVRAQLTSANWPVAVLKEEGTLVYNDQ